MICKCNIQCDKCKGIKIPDLITDMIKGLLRKNWIIIFAVTGVVLILSAILSPSTSYIENRDSLIQPSRTELQSRINY